MSLSETSTTSESPTATATPFPNRFQTEYSSLSLPFILVIALLTAAVLLAVGSVCGSWFWWRKRRGLEVCSVEAWCGNGAWGSDIARLLGRGRRRKRRKNHRETHLESPEDLASSQPEDEDDDDREPPPPAYPLSRSIEEPSQITPAITSEPPAISSPLTPVLATTDQPPVVSPTADVPPAITRNASAASLATLSSSSSSELDSSSTRQPTPDPNYPPPPTMLAFISPPTIPANSPYLDPVMHSQREIDDAVVAAAAEGDAYTARSKEQEAIEEGLPGWMARHPRGPKFARLLHRSRSAPPQSSYPTPLNLSHPLDLYPEEHALLTRLSQHVNPVDQGRTHPGWSGVTIHDGANVVFRKWDAARSAVGTEELVPESWLHLTTHPNGHPPATPNDDVHFSVLIAELGPQRLSEALRSRVSGADPANRQWSRGEGPAAAEARAAARAAGSGRPDHKVGETYPVMTETSTLSSGSNTAASASASDHYRLPSLESQSQSSLEAASATEEQHHPAAMSAQDLASDEPLPSESGSTPRLRGPAGVLRLAQQAARQASVTPSSSGAANHAPGSRGPTSSNGQQQTLGSSNLSQSLLASLTAATEASGDAEDPDAALARRLQREELSQLTRELERERENMARGRRKAVGGKFPHPVHVVVGLVTRPYPPFVLPGRFPDSVALIADRTGNLAVRVCQSSIAFDQTETNRKRRQEMRQRKAGAGARIAVSTQSPSQGRLSDLSRRSDNRSAMTRSVDTMVAILGGKSRAGPRAWTDVMVERGWETDTRTDGGGVLSSIVRAVRPRSNSEVGRGPPSPVTVGRSTSTATVTAHGISRRVSWNRNRAPFGLSDIADEEDSEQPPRSPVGRDDGDDDSDSTASERAEDDFDIGRESILHPTELYGERKKRITRQRSGSHRTKLVPLPYNVGPGDVLGCGFKRGHGIYFTLNGMRIPLPLTTRKRVTALSGAAGGEQEQGRRKFSISFSRRPYPIAPGHVSSESNETVSAPMGRANTAGTAGTAADTGSATTDRPSTGSERPSDGDDPDPTLLRGRLPITSTGIVSQRSIATIDTKGSSERLVDALDPKREVIVDEAGWLMPEWCKEPFGVRGRGGLFAAIGADGPAQLLVLGPGDEVAGRSAGLGLDGTISGLGMRPADAQDMNFASSRPPEGGTGQQIRSGLGPPEYALAAAT